MWGNIHAEWVSCSVTLLLAYTYRMNGKTRDCLNLGSYNYLGFADDWQTSCKSEVMPTLDHLNVSCCSSRMDCGTSRLHVELEELVARYVGKPAALVYNMGYGTNSTTIPALVRNGSLSLSRRVIPVRSCMDALGLGSCVTGVSVLAYT